MVSAAAARARAEQRAKRATAAAAAAARAQPKAAWVSMALWRLLPAIVVIAAVVGSVYEWSHQRNHCLMSYSLPVYTPVPVTSRLSYKYTLYRYTHGRSKTPLRVAGMPVLFVPGHTGSYKQARSVASAAVVASAASDKRGPVEYFTLDFGEEWAGLFGHLVWDQAEFINDAVRTIRVLYARSSPGTWCVCVPVCVAVCTAGFQLRLVYALVTRRRRAAVSNGGCSLCRRHRRESVVHDDQPSHRLHADAPDVEHTPPTVSQRRCLPLPAAIAHHTRAPHRMLSSQAASDGRQCSRVHVLLRECVLAEGIGWPRTCGGGRCGHTPGRLRCGHSGERH